MRASLSPLCQTLTPTLQAVSYKRILLQWCEDAMRRWGKSISGVKSFGARSFCGTIGNRFLSGWASWHEWAHERQPDCRAYSGVFGLPWSLDAQNRCRRSRRRSVHHGRDGASWPDPRGHQRVPGHHGFRVNAGPQGLRPAKSHENRVCNCLVFSTGTASFEPVAMSKNANGSHYQRLHVLDPRQAWSRAAARRQSTQPCATQRVRWRSILRSTKNAQSVVT